METGNTGQRPLTVQTIRGRRQSLDTDRTVSRKELSGCAREAAKALKLRPSLRAVLSELCAVWGEQEWSRVLVWPSNDYLVGRTGLSERGVRYAVRDLVREGLVTVKDSANGKRFAIRAPGGAIIDAYGFDLTPLVARRGEWVERLAKLTAEVERRRRSFDFLTCARRDVSEALLGLATRHPEISSHDLRAAQADLEASSPNRRSGPEPSSELLDAWSELRAMVEERFYQAGCAGNSCPHIETDNGSPSEPCSKSPPRRAGHPVDEAALTPELVLDALPAARAFAPAEILNVAELVDLGQSLRAAIGAHQSAWAEACESLGRLKAALLVLVVTQIHDDDVTSGENRIRNPGGYFRGLVRLASEGRYAVETEILAMRRRRMQ
ncbi:replication protein C [Methylobacterium sp. WL103]|uniref:plasmid replication protein RepC n=1 Tax=Methylobacterium sp. WL103 TaxID=2603891 RepID=UPI0011C936FC|nr:plasmid replication protein RepC [Methylobacterium sp. WL103]TXN07939.1 replication protein C [Methylobacterium sp. WL103]